MQCCYEHGALSYIIYYYDWYHFVVFCVMSYVDIGHSAIKLCCALVLLRCVIVVECYVMLCCPNVLLCCVYAMLRYSVRCLTTSLEKENSLSCYVFKTVVNSF